MSVLVSFIKKEFLLVIRNPQELLVLVVMPLLLITILGFALGSVLDGDAPLITGKAAIVMHTSEEEEIEVFKKELSNLQLPEEVKAQLVEQAQSLLPITMLKDNVFGDPELQSIITLEELPATQLEEAKKAERYSAIIEVPPHFTSSMLVSLFNEEKEVPVLTIYSNEGKELSSGIVEDVVASFQEQYSMLAALSREGLSIEESALAVNVNGSVETLNKAEPVEAISYYAVGMSVMFVLFIASTVSSRIYLEKKLHVFDRILLANVPRWTYLAGVFFSAVILGVLQVAILYTGAALFYGVRWPNVSAFLCITVALCLAIGGITVLLTALNNRLNSESATKLFMGVFVAVLAFIGGSFSPVGNMSEVMEKIGQLTPNGAAMSAYLDVLQGAGIAGVTDHLLVLLLLAATLSATALLIFPRKAGAV